MYYNIRVEKQFHKKKGDYIMTEEEKYQLYELIKKAVQQQNLTPEGYQSRIQELVEKLNI